MIFAIMNANELAASVERNAPFTRPKDVKAGTLKGPVESTMPVMYPMAAPETARCQKPKWKLRA